MQPELKAPTMEGHQQSGVPVVVHRCGNPRDLIAFQITNLMMRQMRLNAVSGGPPAAGPIMVQVSSTSSPDEISLPGR